ncbi:MAG: pilus assembly protein TadG-related protein [bacterium]|nr:pilus assembly protein TadG-related protein [bacterium]
MLDRVSKTKSIRRGAIVVLVAALTVAMVAITALAIDYSYLLKMRTDMQRAADASALAAVQNLIPNSAGTQDLAATRAAVREYANANLASNGISDFAVATDDIEIGRYDTQTIYSSVNLLDSGTFDAVRVTLRRDGSINPQAPLFFGRALGMSGASITVSATAVLQKATRIPAGADVLPFAVELSHWNSMNTGDTLIGYGDGKVQDKYGNDVPGNFGTCDIGPENNSTSDLRDQILNGLRQSDLDALHASGRIGQNQFIDVESPMWVNADPGLSSGMKSAVQAIHGQWRLIPLYDELGSKGSTVNGGDSSSSKGKGGSKKQSSSAGSGNNLEYHVKAWGAVKVLNSNWNGAKNTWVELEKSFLYDGNLLPKPNSLDLSQPVIEGVFTYPVLVE